MRGRVNENLKEKIEGKKREGKKEMIEEGKVGREERKKLGKKEGEEKALAKEGRIERRDLACLATEGSPWQPTGYYRMHGMTIKPHLSQLLILFSLASRGRQSFSSEAPASSELH